MEVDGFIILAFVAPRYFKAVIVSIPVRSTRTGQNTVSLSILDTQQITSCTFALATCATTFLFVD